METKQFPSRVMIIVGGWDNRNSLSTVELIGDSPKNCVLPNLSKGISGSPSMFINKRNNDIVVCGGHSDTQECQVFRNSKWYPANFNDLNEPRKYAVTISINRGTYVIGGMDSPNSIDFLAFESNSWVDGSDIPGPGIKDGCGVLLSNDDVLLIGGIDTRERILKMNLKTGDYEELASGLNHGRNGHKCVVFNKKIIDH